MIWGSRFLNLLRRSRTVWLRGLYGTYKTCVGVEIAKWMMETGIVERTWSNMPCSFATGPSVLEAENCCILFDESWVSLDSRTFWRNETTVWGAFLRKRNVYLLLPSVFSVDSRFRAMDCELVFPGIDYGLPWLHFNWGIETGYSRKSGTFDVFFPRRVWPLYNTKYDPFDDGMILEVLKQAMEFEQLYRFGNPNGKVTLYHEPYDEDLQQPESEDRGYGILPGHEDVMAAAALRQARKSKKR